LFIPDVYIIDIPLDIALKRLYNRYRDTDRMRRLNLYTDFLREQKKYYLSLAKEKSFQILDGRENKVMLAKSIEEKLQF